MGPWRTLPGFPDHFAVNEAADERHPFKLATSPARSFLNSTFNQMPGSVAREGEPSLLIHPDDAATLSLAEGDGVLAGNDRGEVELVARLFKGLQRGIVIAEGLHRNAAHRRGEGINVLTGADQVAPFGGAAVHDTHVWLRRT
jgi:anaerobic selenocysteine-containing dehydrogenase